MAECVPCQVLKECLQFQDFLPSVQTGKLYQSAAQLVTVTCPSGTQVTVNLDAGVVSYVVNFELGNPPYPDLMLNCTGGTIMVPVPNSTTQAQLDALVNGMINTCLSQIAVNQGCQTGLFFNTQQTISCPSNNVLIPGAIPAGISANGQNLTMAAGVVESTISVADANGKALQVLYDMFQTGNTNCSGGPLPIS
jgi:hypothetical protein